MKTRSLLVGSSSLIAAPFILSGAYASENTLTNLIPDLYQGLDVVSRELVGMIPSVFRNVSGERAALGQDIIYPITEESTLGDNTPAMQVPEPTDKTPGNSSIKITKSKNTSFGWTGEEQRGLSHGVGYMSLQADYFAQGLRKLTNEIEKDLYIEAASKAVAGTGTAGTTPFATNVGDSAQVRKVLDDLGAPATERSLVGSTSMGAALRTLQNLSRANEAGTTMTLRDGELLNLNGLSIKESGQAPFAHVTAIGTAANATTTNAGYAIGATTINTAAAGTGTILAGDFVKFAGDSTAYRIKTGNADVSGAGNIVLAAPGLRQAIPAVATAITVVKATAGYGVNVAFPRSAMHLICRAPALPAEGDAAINRTMITDPRSGISFEISLYAGYRKIRAEVAAAWGVGAVNAKHIAALFE